MTTKTITGTYSAGYQLHTGYSAVSITASGSVGGFGLVTSATASIFNAGHLEAGVGHGYNGVSLGAGGGYVENQGPAVILGGAGLTARGNGSPGYAGGNGVYLSVYGAIFNVSGTIGGGVGGAGGNGGRAIYGGVGGGGGAGVFCRAGGYIDSDNLIIGGAGGGGGTSSSKAHGQGAGVGGAGGAAVDMLGYGVVVTFGGVFVGGAGGQAGASAAGLGATGGAGGAGILLSAGGLLQNHSGTIIGGAGGVGGVSGGSKTKYGGTGGAAGAGVVLTSGGNVSNYGLIGGGMGGVGGGGPHYQGFAGDAGAGVVLAGGGTLVNHGTVVGGAGGSGAFSEVGYGVAAYGTDVIVNASGASIGSYKGVTYGVYAGTNSQVTVTNYGTISGGVFFASGLDTLVVEAGSVFNGFSKIRGAASELVLASGVGTISAFIDGGRDVAVSGAIAPTTFYGFATLEIGSSATFTIAAHGDVAVGDTLIDDGVLKIGKTLAVEGTLDVGHVLTGGKTAVLFIDGGTANFTTGASLKAPTVDVSGAAQVNLATDLTYAGVWDQTAGTFNVSQAKTITFTGSGSTFSGLMSNQAGGGIADLMFTSTTAATDTLNAVTIDALRVNITNTTFVVGAGGAAITATAALDFDGTGAGIIGASASDILTLNGGIFGSGAIGEGHMGLVNNGVIQSQDLGATPGLIIDTGSGEDINNNVIYAESAGGLTINSTIVNNGLLIADVGTLTMNGVVSGTGSALVRGGTVYAASTFNQAVTFTTTAGTLELAHGQAYTATITGFSSGGGTYLDLNDVGFVSASEATFSGTSASGTLTVTDGTHAAQIKLSGNYLTANFVSASDGHGGTIIHVMPPAAAAPPALSASAPHTMIAAMATLGAGSAPVATTLTEPWRVAATSLLAPRCA